MNRFHLALILAATTAVAGSLYIDSLATGPIPVAPVVKPVAAKSVQIDLNKSVPIKLPTIKFDLKAVLFHTSDHKEGWEIRLPGGRPIATPAYWNGMLFVGGGYGSHEFYALDAQTGKMIWKYTTSDDGPTAAVVEDGYCAFNTESCTVFVLDAKTGKLVWQQWLGDPLMSQPAIWNGKLYIAYPGGGSHPIGYGSGASQKASGGNVAKTPSGHRMLCADLPTGKHLWDKPITSDVISAPILSGGKVYFACQDGTSFCLDAKTGSTVFKKANASTAAPLIEGGKLVAARKSQKGKATFENLSISDSRGVDVLRSSEAKYLAALPPRMNSNPLAPPPAAMPAPVPGLTYSMEKQSDAAVGFATAPESAGLAGVVGNIPIQTVVAGWAYQGSRPAFNASKQLIANAQGSKINVMSDKKDGVNWSADVRGKGVTSSQQVFSPPAMGKENLYLASGQGHLLALDQQSGSVRFSYATDQPVSFQPALAGGNMYVGTANGLVLCLKTGMSDADGWTGWGGNAQHNKED